MPPTEQLDGKFLGARLTDGDHDDAISVTASTWPWRQRSKTYGVAATFMGKDVACGRNEGLAAHCFRDWLEWHRLLGVDHFVAYDNGSRGDHAWLRVARHYARRGLLTLVDWPYQLGGEGTTGNNVAQRAQLSHAAFAFSPRAVWKDNSSPSHFSAMARPSWLGRAVRNRHHHAIEQALRRWRGGRRERAVKF